MSTTTAPASTDATAAPRRPSTTTILAPVRSHPWLTVRRALWSLRLWDALVITGMWSLAHWLRLGTWAADFLLSNRFQLVLVSVLLAAYVLEAGYLNPAASRWQAPKRFVLACGLAGALIALVFYLTGIAWTGGGTNLLGRGVVLPALCATAFLGILPRLSLHARLAAAWPHHRWLVVGHGRDAALPAFLTRPGGLPSESVHRWDPVDGGHELYRGGERQTIGQADGALLSGGPWAGIVLLDDIALDDANLERLMHARLAGTPVYSLAEFYERHFHKVPVMHLDNRWFAITGGFGLLHEPVHRQIKRLCDILLALMLLLLTAPLQLLAALGVRVFGGPGPVIYSQVRSGTRGEPFTIYKFRSMRQDAEQAGAQWAAKGDARVFALGRLLRKFRIDELPQLWNILRGDMSFIGPRPERPEFTAELERVIPYFGLRLLVKPGLTGWAQVNYPYGASVEDAREKLEYDLYYIKHQSLWLDLRIVLRTMRVVLRGFGGR